MTDYFSTELGANMEEIKRLLDSSFMKDKMQGMKALMALVSTGQDASVFYPDVVKNVIVPNIEVKKLVYMFLAQYAELNQELALLSINSFQKDLADKNPLIRGLALRSMSSVRVRVIVPLVVLAIKERLIDGSPYVRKIAAFAITKVHFLDHEQKPTLVEMIARLLTDRSTMVLGAAVTAFCEVCPERMDLIDSAYHRLVAAVIDMDEWAQIVTLGLLTRYARTQFEDPNDKAEPDLFDEGKFYSDSEEEEEGKARKKKQKNGDSSQVKEMDADHRSLLEKSKLLLHNRNAGVVLQVVSLLHALAPRRELQVVVKPLILILNTHPEMKFVVLSNIKTLVRSPLVADLFMPQCKHFYLAGADSSNNRLLKLDILVHLAHPTNILAILQELEAYTRHYDNLIVTEAVHAVAQCAVRIPSAGRDCMKSLLRLLASKRSVVVAESVVAIRSLLSRQREDRRPVVTWLAGLIGEIEHPTARAAIVWCVGEFYSLIPEYAPDVLRMECKLFPKEKEEVKLAVLTLAVKLFIQVSTHEGGKPPVGADEIPVMLNYVLSMARCDASYDVRDRARLLQRLLLPTEEEEGGEGGLVAPEASRMDMLRTLLLAEKPAPEIHSDETMYTRFALGTLSHIVKHAVFGYEALPPFPADAPDPGRRKKAQDETHVTSKPVAAAGKGGAFYSDEEESSSEGSEESSEESGSEEGSSSEEENSDESSDASEEDSSDEEDSEEEDSDTPAPAKPEKRSRAPQATPAPVASQPAPAESFDLLSLFAPSSSSTGTDSVLTPSSASPDAAPTSESAEQFPPASPLPALTFDLLDRAQGLGLHVTYQYSRKESLVSKTSTTLRLRFQNLLQTPITNISMPAGDPAVHGFETIATLGPGSSVNANVYIDFKDKLQPVKFTITTDLGSFPVSITPRIGELLNPNPIDPTSFESKKKKLGGMHENTRKFAVSANLLDRSAIAACVWQAMHVAAVSSPDPETLRFVGRTVSAGSLVLLTVAMGAKDGKGECRCCVNTENMLLGVMLLDDLKNALTQS